MNQHMLMECSMVRIVLNVLIFDLTMTVEGKSYRSPGEISLYFNNQQYSNATLQKKTGLFEPKILI